MSTFNLSDKYPPIAQDLSDRVLAALTGNLYVSSVGSDDNPGDNQFNAFLTIGKALEVAESGTRIVVLDATDLYGPFTVPEGVYVYADGSSVYGEVTLKSGAHLTCNYHRPTADDQVLLRKEGTRYSHYSCIGSDARGFSGVTNLLNTTAQAILFADVQYMFTSSTGVQDESEGGPGSLTNIALTPSGFASSTLQSGQAVNVADNQPSGNFAQWQISPVVTSGGSIEGQNHWIQYDAGEDLIISRYSLRTNFSVRAPRGWKLYGSADGMFAGEEVLIESKTDETSWSNDVYNNYANSNTDAYRFFRFVWTQGMANNFLRISGLKLVLESPDVGGHIHFNIKDLYLVGEDAVGIDSGSSNSDIIGYVDHIVPFPEAINATAVHVAGGGRAEITCNEIRFTGHTAYSVDGGGILTLNCLRILGAEIGEAVLPGSGGGGELEWITISGNTTAESGKGYMFNGSLTLTLPENPEPYDRFGWKVLTGEAILGRNGKLIEGEAADLVLDIEKSGGVFVYEGEGYGWVNVTEIGAGGGGGGATLTTQQKIELIAIYG